MCYKWGLPFIVPKKSLSSLEAPFESRGSHQVAVQKWQFLQFLLSETSRIAINIPPDGIAAAAE